MPKSLPESPSDPTGKRRTHAQATLERWFRTTPAILHSIDSDGRLIEVSDAWLEKFGYLREEVLGRRSSDFLTPESRDYAIREVLREFYRSGRCDNIEYQMVCKDGRVLDILLSAVLDPGDGEHGSCSLAVLTDVTALRRAERKLAESETLYKALIENQTDLVSLAKPDGELLFVNQAHARHYDKQPHEVMGTNLLDYVPESFREPVREHLGRVCASKLSIESENQVVMPDGQTRWMSWTNRAITDSQGRVTAIHSVGRDIERRVVAEERMKASEARYRLIAENSSDLVMLARNDGLRKYVSPSSQKLLGWSPEEMLEMRASDSIHPDDFVETWRALIDVGHDPVTMTHRMRRRDGSYIWVEAVARQVEIAGEGAHRLSVIRNIDRRVAAERRLKDSEARYRLLAENSSDMVLLVRSDGQRKYVSPACRKLLGWTPEEMLAIRTWDAVHPDDAERVTAWMTDSEMDHLTWTYRLRRKDGAYIWVEAASERVSIDGEPPHRLLVVRDIEHRIEAERRLKESEERYRLLADHSSDMVILARKEGERKYVSPACRKLVGWSPEEMLAMTAKDMIHPEDFPTAWSAQNDPRNDHVVVTYRIRRKDGAFIWVEAASQRVEIAGEGQHRLVVIRDVEQRVEAERRIKESEASYRLLAENSSDMVFQLDCDLVRRYVSPACREILGYEPSELIGAKRGRDCHPADAERVGAVYRSLLAGEVERQSVINRRQHRDGRWIWVETQMKALKDPNNGVVCGIVGALRDITQRKAVEDELAQANRRLEILARRDGLTGLANRRAFDEALAREHLRAARESAPLALIMVDVDRFKAFNDRYGHPAGDRCLRQVARALASAIRQSSDLAARYGGEEFAVLLPNTETGGAAEVAERIRLAVRDLELEHEGGIDRIVTISAGVAAMLSASGGGPDLLLKEADSALYRAKRAGRDLVVDGAWSASRDIELQRNAPGELLSASSP